MNRCIINTEDKETTEFLTELGYECIPVIPSDRVSGPVSAHSDVLYRKLNKNTIMISGCQNRNLQLLKLWGYTVIKCDELSPGYTTESYLNFIINDSFIIRNHKTAIELDNSYITNKKIIDVKQGYTSCSTIQVTENAYITDDENIYGTLIMYGIDCLKIKKGDIELCGYNYGFIGGASVKLKEDSILFFGNINDTTDKNNVIEFLNKYNIEAVFIEGKKLKDIGSALIL